MSADSEGHVPNPPSRRSLLIWTGAAALAAGLIVFGAVLPAEYDRDPLGLGRATGLSRLWAPREVRYTPAAGAQPIARDYPMPFRTDEVVIPLASSEDYYKGGTELEYKVRMKRGGTLVYSWVAEGVDDPEDFYIEFHGHTLAATREAMTVAEYQKASLNKANGALTAPFDGIHGWFLQNSAVRPVKVRLKLAGYYELIPPGQEGNLAGVSPLPASR